jgi:hypothetical protein
MRYVFVGLVSILFLSCKDKVETIQYDNCIVKYNVYQGEEKELPSLPGHSISNDWELESAKRKLAICLCESYLAKPSSKLKTKIFELYHTKETYFSRPVNPNISIDSIIAKRKEIFAPTIFID